MPRPSSKPKRPIYRTVEVAMWSSDDFRALSRPEPNAQTLWVYLLTGEHTTQIPGIWKAGRMSMAEDLHWDKDLPGFDRAWAEIEALGMAFGDWPNRVVWVPKKIDHEPPDNPNVILGWRASWRSVPPSPLRDRAFAVLHEWCVAKDRSKGRKRNYENAFLGACETVTPNHTPNPTPTQHPNGRGEQRTENREQLTVKTVVKEGQLNGSREVCSAEQTPRPEPRKTTASFLLDDGSRYQVEADLLAAVTDKFPDLDIAHELDKLELWCGANSRKRKTRRGAKRFVNAWLTTAETRRRENEAPPPPNITTAERIGNQSMAEFRKREAAINAGDDK